MRPLPANAIVLVAALGLGGTSSAQAENAPPEHPSADPTSDRGRAVDLFRQANEAYKEDRYEDAASLFAQAWRLARTYDVAANYGHTAFQLSRYRQAAELLSFALARWPQTGPTVAKQAAMDRLAEARKHVGAVRIAVTPPGARVRLDGTEVGVAPLDAELFVDPGPHVVEAELEGYALGRAQLDAAAGATQEATLTLHKPAVLPPSEEPDASAEDPNIAPPIIVGSVGLVGVIVGIGMLVAADTKASEANETLDALQAEAGYPDACHDTSPLADSSECSSVRELREDHDSIPDVGVTGLVIGGAALAASAVWLGILLSSDEWIDSKGAEASGASPESPLVLRSWLSPGAARTTAGIIAEGQF